MVVEEASLANTSRLQASSQLVVAEMLEVYLAQWLSWVTRHSCRHHVALMNSAEALSSADQLIVHQDALSLVGQVDQVKAVEVLFRIKTITDQPQDDIS